MAFPEIPNSPEGLSDRAVRNNCAFCHWDRSADDRNHAPTCPYWDFFGPQGTEDVPAARPAPTVSLMSKEEAAARSRPKAGETWEFDNGTVAVIEPSEDSHPEVARQTHSSERSRFFKFNAMRDPLPVRRLNRCQVLVLSVRRFFTRGNR